MEDTQGELYPERGRRNHMRRGPRSAGTEELQHPGNRRQWNDCFLRCAYYSAPQRYLSGIQHNRDRNVSKHAEGKGTVP